MNEEQRASQLSAMFDGELPASECELMARRLTRDDALRAQWERYALIGAALRRAPGESLELRVASRVRLAVSAEAGLAGDGDAADSRALAEGRQRIWARPAAGFIAAAVVAGIAVIGLRGRDAALSEVDSPALVAASTPVQELPAETTVVLGPSGALEPESYVVPVSREAAGLQPPAQLANYVVAHSEVSMPLSRRNLLSALVAAGQDEAGDEPAPATDVVDER
jgi:negative regulator of sigma E activity